MQFFVFFPFEIQPIITLEGSVSHTFHRLGKNKVTVQVACGSTVMQDSNVITVKGEWVRHFKALYLELHEYAIWYLRKSVMPLGQHYKLHIVDVNVD